MKKFIDILTEELQKAFKKAGYDEKYAKVALSARPDLCEYQSGGALAAAKQYKKAPLQIAKDVSECLKDSECIRDVSAAAPGFINMTVSPKFLASYLLKMSESVKLGAEPPAKKKTVIIDYGGANVAKPLHVGHLRSAVIGESVKRIIRFMGHDAIGDVHLGDWGYQMGLIITELHERKPYLSYFDDDFRGEYPKEPPFTLSELEEMYPSASARAKKDENYRNEALSATYELQRGHRGYRAIWKHIMDISVADLKKNYEALNVHFDLWKGESDAQDFIPEMVDYLKSNGYARTDEGALIVDVKEEGDTKEVPPCMILKSDGAALYDTTDLATIMERERDFKPDEIIYVTDKRQELHFIQVFRCARKTHLASDTTKLTFIGFGTVNGKDGKPFKTREGGVMRLEQLLSDIKERMYKKIAENDAAGREDETGGTENKTAARESEMSGPENKTAAREDETGRSENKTSGREDETGRPENSAGGSQKEDKVKPAQSAEEIASKVAVAAIKYGDLSNQASKDYIFDIDRFTSFEGNTGPYILYTDVRIKSVLARCEREEADDERRGYAREDVPVRQASEVNEKAAYDTGIKGCPDDGTELLRAAFEKICGEASVKSLMLKAAGFNQVAEEAYEDLAPHKICSYTYDLANAFNRFYHEVRIITEEDKPKRAGYIALLKLIRRILETCMDLLGFEAPDRM